jgi:hypothetical protein
VARIPETEQFVVAGRRLVRHFWSALTLCHRPGGLMTMLVKRLDSTRTVSRNAARKKTATHSGIITVDGSTIDCQRSGPGHVAKAAEAGPIYFETITFPQMSGARRRCAGRLGLHSSALSIHSPQSPPGRQATSSVVVVLVVVPVCDERGRVKLECRPVARSGVMDVSPAAANDQLSGFRSVYQILHLYEDGRSHLLKPS